jgi:hypothetical protein
VKRLTNLKDINGEHKSSTENEFVDKIIENLNKINRAKRPQSIKKLESHIKSFDKSLADSKVHDAIEELFRRRLISSTVGSRIKYTEYS